VRTTIQDKLTADATFMDYFPGGVWIPEDVEPGTPAEISRESTPQAFDASGVIKPCVWVRMENTVPVDPHPSAARMFCTIIFYQPTGYSSIDAGMDRAFDLLHGSHPSGVTWEILHVEDVKDRFDDHLKCAMGYARYLILSER
jgi:hypothetical protein